MDRSCKWVGIVAATAAMGVGATADADILYSQGFDGPVDSYLSVLDGWTQQDSRGYIKAPVTHGWDGQSGAAAGIFFPYNKRVLSPSIDTSAHEYVRVGLDLRPSDTTVSAYGGIVRVYVKDPDTGATAEAMRVLFDNASKTLVRTNGFTSGANTETEIPWSYNEDAVNSLEFIIDQVNRRYSLVFDNGDQVYQQDDLRWTDLSLGGPLGTFDHIEIQGGSGGTTEQADPTRWLAFDNFYVTDGAPVPEPASLALLGLGGLAALRRRR